MDDGRDGEVLQKASGQLGTPAALSLIDEANSALTPMRRLDSIDLAVQMHADAAENMAIPFGLASDSISVMGSSFTSSSLATAKKLWHDG